MSQPTTTTQTNRRPMAMGMGFGRGGMMTGAGEKPQNFKKTMRQLLSYLRPFWLPIGAVLLCAIASTSFAIASPKILGNVTNTVVTGYVQEQFYDKVTTSLHGHKLPAGTTGKQFLDRLPDSVTSQIPTAQRRSIESLDMTKRPGIDFAGISWLVFLLVGFYGLSAFLSYAQGWIMSGVSQSVSYNLRRDISLKINRLPLRYFDTRTHGEVLSRVTNDVDTVSRTLNQSLSQIVTSVTTIIGILAMMLSISWQMTLVALLVLPLSMVFIRLIIGKSQAYFLQLQNFLGDLNGHVEEMFSGHTVMKAFNGEQASIERFDNINQQLYDSAWKSQFLSGLLMPIMMFVSNLGYVAVAVLGGWLAIKGTINIGDIQAFIQYMSQFTQPITQTANIANVLQSTAAAAERVFIFLAEPEEADESKKTATLIDVKGQVTFENVAFGYQPDQTIIHNFSTTIQPGWRVAIVGPTGAGKTTMVNLLMRFYDPRSGRILVDGVDTQQMKRRDVRALFGMVLQDTWLFNGTIENNIAYGRPAATHEQVVEAAKAAHSDHFIRALPGSYKMILNEEADNISQGEKQLLTIARVVLADSPMLILDEATSSVDTRTEELIQKAMDQLMQGRTCFIIAHRLSTIRNADLILVMRDGNIVEQGTHAGLLEKNGFYAELYNSQFS